MDSTSSVWEPALWGRLVGVAARGVGQAVQVVLGLQVGPRQAARGVSALWVLPASRVPQAVREAVEAPGLPGAVAARAAQVAQAARVSSALQAYKEGPVGLGVSVAPVGQELLGVQAVRGVQAPRACWDHPG